jgi:hypothetical protein
MVTTPEHQFPDNPRMPEGVASGLYSKALTVTVAFGVLLAIGFITDSSEGHKQFFFSYLHGFCYGLSIALGCLFWNMIHHLADAGWSTGIRRTFENVHRALPFLAIAFIPLALSLGSVYKWVGVTEISIKDDMKRTWLSPMFFCARIAFYFAVWIGYSRFMRNNSIRQDTTRDIAITKKVQWWAPSGILCLGLTATFAAFDLIMSLNYTWFSTIFGVYFWAGSIRSSMAFCILTVLFLRSSGYLKNSITREHLHDMGKLSFGFTVFWTYIAFAQYFLQWYGNIPEEVQFFNHRRYDAELNPTTWYTMSVMLPLCYFVVPFVTLLPRGNKRNPKVLAFVASWILAFHCFDQYWLIMPEQLKATVHDFPVSGVAFHWISAAAIVFFLSLNVTCLFHGWTKAPLIPVGDPRMEESLHFENDEFGDPA